MILDQIDGKPLSAQVNIQNNQAKDAVVKIDFF